MRDRYYVRSNQVVEPIVKAEREWYRQWREQRRDKSRPDPENYETSRNRWFLERHNIVFSSQANGAEKVGFASRGDMLLFVLRYS